jgi:predicted AlkP superfamily pyrophosphatase or phosphodiesterase
VTAEKHDLRSAIHMWPGSEAHIGGIEPTYLDRFNSKEHLDNKVRQVINWLDLPGPEDPNTSKDTPRPQLIAFYVPDVDSDGHAFGPNSTYIRSTIAEVDGMLGKLVTALDQRNLTDIVNVVVVSDHGMATTSTERLIQFEDLIDPALIAHTDGWPLYGLRPVDPSPENLQKLYNDLLAKSLLPENKDHFKVYLRDTNMPPEYHFSRNPRIAPLWIVPAVGWAIVTRSEFNLSSTSSSAQVYHPRGLHGYDHTHPLMRAIFAARGPAFSHHLPAGTRLEPFQNIEVYNLVCDSLGIPPVPNNGTLRLPFTSAHSAPAGPASTTAAADYEDGDISAALEVPHGSSSSAAALDDSAGQILPPTFPVVGVPDAEKAPGGGGGHDDAASPALSTLTGVLVGASPPSSLPSPSPPLPAPVGGEKKTFWEWMREKFNSIKNWGG